MSLLEIWCNELQECYVLLVDVVDFEIFKVICECECCLFVVVGEVIEQCQLIVVDSYFDNKLVDMLLEVLFGKVLCMYCVVICEVELGDDFDVVGLELQESVECVLCYFVVVSKSFLIIIGDCIIIGLVVCDQMVGFWQVLVVDCVVIVISFDVYIGEVMVMGECILLVLLDVLVFGCMVIGEMVINLVVVCIGKLFDIKFFVNWMVVVGYFGEDVCLYDMVKVVGMELCLELGIIILVGKDLMFMKICWQDNGEDKSVIFLVLLIVIGFVLVVDVCQSLIL